MVSVGEVASEIRGLKTAEAGNAGPASHTNNRL